MKVKIQSGSSNWLIKDFAYLLLAKEGRDPISMTTVKFPMEMTYFLCTGDGKYQVSMQL